MVRTSSTGGFATQRLRLQCWVGDMYTIGSGPSALIPILLLIFNDEPDEKLLLQRLNALTAEGDLTKTKLFAVFDDGNTLSENTTLLNEQLIEIWPRKGLLRQSLK